MKIHLPGIRVRNVVGNKIYCYCPAHKGGQERSPSMVVFTDNGTWKCYTCSPQPKPLVELLHLYGGATIAQAQRLVEDLRSRSIRVERQEERPTCPEYLLGPFDKRPLLLIQMGFDRKVIDEMEVGWDEDRYRVIYPLRYPDGRLFGVSGGAVYKKGTDAYAVRYGDEPKYIAYGPRQGFPFQANPKWSLWNYHNVRVSTVDEPVVIVEGFKALLWVKMAGVTNVVSLSGTGFTKEQVSLLALLRGPFRIFLDNDPDGRAATPGLVHSLRRRTSGVKAVTYPRQVNQPDDLTLEEVRKCLDI